MLPEMCVHVTLGVGIPSAEHVILSDVLYSRSTISAIIGATVDEKRRLNSKFYVFFIELNDSQLLTLVH